MESAWQNLNATQKAAKTLHPNVGGGFQNMMVDVESEGYVNSPMDYYKLCQNLPKFYFQNHDFH